MVNNKPIRWDTSALQQFGELIAYIAESSLQNAEHVRNEVFKKIGLLPINPEIYPPDKYKLDNQAGFYRAFELYRFRVSYFIGDDHIRILRVRHTSQDPKIH